ALQVEEQRTAGCRGPSGTTCRCGHVRAVRTANRERSEAARSCRGGIAKKAHHAVKQVPALKKPAKHLRVVRVQPLAAEFHRVTAGHDGEVVPDLYPLHQLVDVWFKEERMAKPECRAESHRGVRRHVR